MPIVTVTRTHLRLASPGDLQGRRVADPDLTFTREDPCAVATSRALYAAVGGPYHWRDRDAWSDRDLGIYLAQPGLSVWILRRGAETAGYVELHQQDDGSVEVVNFGLLPPFHGRGLGAHLLTIAVEQCWSMRAAHVHLHTCTLDGPAALPNYLARGFIPVRTEQYETTIPDAPGST